MSMKCNKCGQELLEDVKFCTNCGSPIVQSKPLNINQTCGGEVLISTTSEIQGYRVAKYCNTISATSVEIAAKRSGLFEAIDAFSGNLGGDSYLSYTEETNYISATNGLISKARECNCNAVIGVRYNDHFTEGVLCVTAYGTACVIEKE